MASTYVYRNNDATAGGGYTSTWTWSGWVKRGTLGEQGLFMNRRIDHVSNSRMRFQFSSSDNLFIETKDSTSNDNNYMETKMKFRDTNAWYHIVLAFDTTLTDTTDMIKIWINNKSIETELGGWNSPDRASNGFGTLWSSATRSMLGIATNNSNTDFMFNGSMSHIHFTYGTAYTPSAFGETDATTGEWKIKTSPSVTYGSQGFFVLKDGNSATDQSGEGNNMTIDGGTLTKTEDSPSNVFCTYNPLQQTNGSTSISLGNNYFTNTGQWLGVNGTIAATSGKYYAEFKVTGSNGWGIGVADVDSEANRTDLLSTANAGYQSKYTGGKQIFLNGSTIVALENNSTVIDNAGMGNTSFVANDIVMVALDLDNNNLFFGKNGTWLRGATESEIEAGTSTNATFSGTSFNDKFWTWSVCSEFENMYMNAGNGYFGTTAVSSAGTNASGNGIFEHDVPAGFTALSTKGLNE
jgi:hypothetical protein